MRFRVTLAVGGGPGCPIRGPLKMKVWQAGSHLTDQRDARVDDWSWARTRTRLAILSDSPARTGREPRSPSSRSLGYTLVALAAALPRKARGGRRDRGWRPRDADDRRRRRSSRPASRRSRSPVPRRTSQVGSGSARSPTFASSSSGTSSGSRSATSSETGPGAIISRITNDVEALDQLVTDGISSLVQNTPPPCRDGRRPLPARLAPRARDADRAAADGRRYRVVPGHARIARIGESGNGSGS